MVLRIATPHGNNPASRGGKSAPTRDGSIQPPVASAACTTLWSSIDTVTGPTPPGTGLSHPASRVVTVNQVDNFENVCVVLLTLHH